MKTDRELLELAAKAAAAIDTAAVWYGWDGFMHLMVLWEEEQDYSDWNPLTDDGDALRLAVKLRLLVDICADHTCVCNEKVDPLEQSHGKDGMEATRRAIVRAAAAIGESMND